MAVNPPLAEHAPVSLSAADCRDPERLEAFLKSEISPNAWPIHSRVLRRRVEEKGLDLSRLEAFSLSTEALVGLMERFERWGARVESWLGVDLAYHHLLHNFEVTLRLLLLEWPAEVGVPEDLAASVERTYSGTREIRPILVNLVRRLAEVGVSDRVLARDLLAGLGHDYGHSGGTDRVHADGTQTPLTHEETAERHVARFGLDAGFPAELVLEAMAGIRATTFHRRADRAPVAAANDFEHKITLADVAGCVLESDTWLTHVSIPVLKEKLPAWRRRRVEIPREIARVEQELGALDEADGPNARRALERHLEELEKEKAQIIEDLPEVFRGERGFLFFIRDHRLAQVEQGKRLWTADLEAKLELIEGVLALDEPLEALRNREFTFLESYAETLAQGDLRAYLARGDIDPDLRIVLERFLPPGG